MNKQRLDVDALNVETFGTAVPAAEAQAAAVPPTYDRSCILSCPLSC